MERVYGMNADGKILVTGAGIRSCFFPAMRLFMDGVICGDGPPL